MPSTADDFYEIAGEEIASKQFVPGIWTKAFSAALGEPNKTVALYIKFRVEQLNATRRAEKVRSYKSKVFKHINEKKTRASSFAKDIDRVVEKTIVFTAIPVLVMFSLLALLAIVGIASQVSK